MKAGTSTSMKAATSTLKAGTLTSTEMTSMTGMKAGMKEKTGEG